MGTGRVYRQGSYDAPIEMLWGQRTTFDAKTRTLLVYLVTMTWDVGKLRGGVYTTNDRWSKY